MVALGESEIHFPIIFDRREDDVWVHGSIAQTDQGLIAMEFIQVPGNGDIAMRLLVEELQKQATLLGRPVMHIYTAANRGSLALVERTDGYAYIGENDDHKPVYSKVYHP